MLSRSSKIGLSAADAPFQQKIIFQSPAHHTTRVDLPIVKLIQQSTAVDNRAASDCSPIQVYYKNDLITHHLLQSRI